VSAPSPTLEPDDAPECDHEWEFVDDSFSHEFGTEVCGHWECLLCGATTTKCPVSEDFSDHD
jgi:NADH dehydrogenase/NADH:ubiquinone oxidoreductase subunit G